jgi:hypothetical protein
LRPKSDFSVLSRRRRLIHVYIQIFQCVNSKRGRFGFNPAGGAMFLGLVLAVRITNLIGETTYLPIVSEPDLPMFLSQHKLTVILYETIRYAVQFMDFAIARYEGRITFAISNATPRPAVCQKQLCFMAYQNGVELPLGEPGYSPALFAQWCERALDPYGYQLTRREQVWLLFDRKAPVLLGVALDTWPDNISKSLPFYLVSEAAIRPFELNLTRGVYVYRPKDRQLRPFRGDFEKEIQTNFKGANDK